MSADVIGTRVSLGEVGTVKSDVNEEPGMGSADSSLTAAGGSDQTVVDAERINAEDASARWPSHNSGQPYPPFVAPVQQPPGSWPRLQSEGSGPSVLPAVSSFTAADGKYPGYPQMAMCRMYADKSYSQLVDACEKFDPVSAASDYNFHMWLSADPIGKQFAAVMTEMRRLVFSVLPDHAARHLEWWKKQCAMYGWTYKACCTDPPYVLSLWATSCKQSHKRVQNFWARIEALLADFFPENVAEQSDSANLDDLLVQPFSQPGRVCMGITDSTFVGYSLKRWSVNQQQRWEEAKVSDYEKGWNHESVGHWIDTLMKSAVWPSADWSFVHLWYGQSPLTLSHTWKATAAGPSTPQSEWTRVTGNGDVAYSLEGAPYHKDLFAPALARAANSNRTLQPEVLEPEFFGSKFSKGVPSGVRKSKNISTADGKSGRPWNPL